MGPVSSSHYLQKDISRLHYYKTNSNGSNNREWKSSDCQIVNNPSNNHSPKTVIPENKVGTSGISGANEISHNHVIDNVENEKGNLYCEIVAVFTMIAESDAAKVNHKIEIQDKECNNIIEALTIDPIQVDAITTCVEPAKLLNDMMEIVTAFVKKAYVWFELARRNDGTGRNLERLELGYIAEALWSELMIETTRGDMFYNFNSIIGKEHINVTNNLDKILEFIEERLEEICPFLTEKQTTESSSQFAMESATKHEATPALGAFSTAAAEESREELKRLYVLLLKKLRQLPQQLFESGYTSGYSEKGERKVRLTKATRQKRLRMRRETEKKIQELASSDVKACHYKLFT